MRISDWSSDVCSSDLTGRGEGVPYPRYGESTASALAAIEAARGAIEAGATREEIQRIMPAGAARNAVDCALWDLEAKISGQSVTDRLGRPPLGGIGRASCRERVGPAV